MCDDHGRDVKNFQEKQPGAVPSFLSFSLVAVLALYAAELVSPYGACNLALRSADCFKYKPYVRFIWFLRTRWQSATATWAATCTAG